MWACFSRLNLFTPPAPLQLLPLGLPLIPQNQDGSAPHLRFKIRVQKPTGDVTETTSIIYTVYGPNSGAASFEGRIWRPHTSQRRVKCCPISKGPSNAAEICSLRFPDLKDASDGSFTAQHIPTFIARWMRQLQRIYLYNILILLIYI